MTTAKYLTFEGPDTCGKTTQIKLVIGYLSGLNLPVRVVREPGGTPLAEVLRSVLLFPEKTAESLSINGGLENKEFLTGVSELFIFLSARSQLFDYVILPELARGINIIGDRGRDSTRAYQGAGRFKDDPPMLERIDDLNDVATRNRRPDLTIILDLPVKTIFERINSRGQEEITAFELNCKEEFFERVREQFLAIAQREPNRAQVIDGNQSIEKVFADIKPHLKKLFGINDAI